MSATALPLESLVKPRGKFADPARTAKDEPRAIVSLESLRTLWFNTGSLCNLSCKGCYVESTPRNDRLCYISRADVQIYLAELAERFSSVREIGFTGGEPFMNPQIVDILDDVLSASYRTLVLTNAMAPMRRHKNALLELNSRYGKRLAVRVSLDHFSQEGHERVRGRRSWAPAIAGLKWLSDNGIDLAVAARILGEENERSLRKGFAALFEAEGIRIDAGDPHRLVLFPDMDATADVPEITQSCWTILGKRPSDVMCASSRMVIKRKGADRPSVVSCTLLPYEEAFEMGRTLADASRPVSLNHPHCAKFCVLGGASCSA